MNEEKTSGRNLDPERLTVLRSLPAHIVDTFTKEEMDAFLFEDEWPDSLKDKLKDYIAD